MTPEIERQLLCDELLVKRLGWNKDEAQLAVDKAVLADPTGSIKDICVSILQSDVKARNDAYNAEHAKKLP
jgi:hypothetical protein